MIFFIGFTLMFINEGFVMMRHVSPLFAQIREELIKDFGDTWQKIHSTLDWLWILFVVLGLILSHHRALDVFFLVTFWSAALCLIYIPMWLKTFWAKKYPEKISGI
tara:strand:+ start:2168 stop:2485 length:318 start_codon:yes stop_codon:yes gene_type:complete